MTAVTVTLFYVILEIIWHARFQTSYGWFGWCLLLLVPSIRFALLIPSGNEWKHSTSSSQPWNTIRNIPLVVQGLGVAYLILRDASIEHDKTYKWIGICIVLSYVCYIPTMIWIQQNEMLGMLMIPKTIAYVAIGFLAYFRYFNVIGGGTSYCCCCHSSSRHRTVESTSHINNKVCNTVYDEVEGTC